jgi:CubicO group peptidase (beta-lactamase class C family)
LPSDDSMTHSGVDTRTAHRLAVALGRAQAVDKMPSITAGVVRGGEALWFGSAGTHLGPHADGVDPASVQYRVGSITKTFTAILVLQLVREGLVDLNSPAAAVVGPVPFADRSVRSLLAHHGGVPAEPVGPWWEAAPGRAWDQLVSANAAASEVFSEGQRFHYSNLAYALLGRVVEQARAQPWWRSVQERILDPLGLRRTTYLPAAPFATGYAVHPYARTLHEERATDTGVMAPAGQLWSTAADLATYADFLLTGHPDVLELADLAQAVHPQSGVSHVGLGYAHGLGFMLIPGGATGGANYLFGHTGSMPGFRAACFVDPDRGAGVVVLANGTGGLDSASLARELLDVLQDQEPAVPRAWEPNGIVPHEFQDLLGVWHWGLTPFVFEVDGAQLCARRNGVAEYHFSIREGRIVGTSGYHDGEELVVVRDGEDQVVRLEVATFVFSRKPVSF